MANETILIVDADTKSQKVLEVSFKKAGYRVVMTDGPSRARELVQDVAPDIIISDTQFGGDGTGFEFLADIKQGELKNTPFIFLTEERALPQKMKGFELGADDYLTKPIYIKEVTTRVELLLQKRAKEQLSEDDIEELEGNLADITMIDLLQTIEEELRSGTIHLTREHQSAVIYFREGNILDAICGKLQGEEAIYRLMLWPDGEFVLRYHDQVRRVDRIEKDSGALLLEGIRRLDGYNELIDALPNLGHVFEGDYKKLAQVMSQLPNEVARILRLFDGLRSIEEVVEGSPLDDITTLQIVEKLIDDTYLIDVTPSQGGRERQRSRSNLAAWLDSARESSDGGRGTEIGREDTSPKFGNSISRETAPATTGRRRETVDGFHTSQTESLGGESKRGIRDTDPFGSGSSEEEGSGRRSTIPLVEAIDRLDELDDLDDHVPKEARRQTMLQWDRPRSGWNIHFDAPEEGGESAIREIEEGERRRQEEEARQISGESRDSTLRFAPAVDRDGGGEPNQEQLRQIEEDERRRRAEEARRLQEQLSTIEPADDAQEREPERPEVTARRRTDELPSQPRVPLITDGEERVDTDELHSEQLQGRERSVTPLSSPAANLQEEASEPQGGGLSDVSEADVFEDSDEMERELFGPSDSEVEEEAAAADVSEEPVEPSEGDAFNERQMFDIRPPAKLTPLGVEASEPEVNPAGLFDGLGQEDTAPGGESSEEEDLNIVAVEALEPLPDVERQATDNKLVRAEFDLSRRKTIAPYEISGRPEAMADRETLEIDTPNVSTPGVTGAESDFFSEEPDYVDDFGSADERIGALPIVLLVAAILTVVALFAFYDGGDVDQTVVRNDVNETTTITIPQPVETNPPPEVEPPGLDNVMAQSEARGYGDGLARNATELTMVLSGADLFGTDAGVAANAADAGTEVAAIDPEPTLPDPIEAPDPQPEPVAVVTPDPIKTPDPRPDPQPEQKPDAEPSTDKVSLREAERLVNRERFTEALPLLRELSKQSSSDGKVAFLHGKAAFNSNKTGEAVEQLTRAERLGYRTADLYLDLAASLMLDGKRDRAKWAYEKFLQKQPNGRVADEVRTILDTQF